MQTYWRNLRLIHSLSLVASVPLTKMAEIDMSIAMLRHNMDGLVSDSLIS